MIELTPGSSTRARSRAFTVMELLSMLLLIAVAFLLLTRLFGASMRVIREAPVARDELVRYDAMIEALRGDVWSAKETRIQDDGSKLVINAANGGQEDWSISRVDGSDAVEVSRSSGNDRRSWKIARNDAPKFAAPSYGVTVLRQDSTANSINLVSQIRILGASGGGR